METTKTSISHGALAVTIHVLPSGRAHLTAYRGKALRPCANYMFRSEAEALHHVEGMKVTEDARVRHAAERKAERNKPHTLKVGDILVYSWGWEQTNKDFFQVVATTGASVKLREIASRSEGHREGYHPMSDHVVAVPDSFKGEEVVTKRSNSTNCVAMRHGSASPWDGQPEYVSWYA